MLKLTNSFYRYFMVTCERVHCKAHVRNVSHLSLGKERCGVDCIQYETKSQFHCTQSVHKQSGRKRLIKIPPLSSNELDCSGPMSESALPTDNYVSYGGQFEVSTDEQIPSENWQNNESSCSDGEKPPFEIPPDFRVWESVGNQSNYCNGGFRFKVVSYNVLAQYLLECHPYLYTDCSPKNLKWKIRAARLYDEIVGLDPDIVCLQEVQVTHLESFYSKFEELGYTGVFKQKTGHRQDGCAIYFKHSLFHLQEYISVEFYQPELPLLNRDNIGVLAKLSPRAALGGAGAGPPLVVATTHLLYNPKRTDVRLAQLQVLLAEIDRFAYYTTGYQSGHLPIILTGDLNALPESAVIKLLDKGHVRAGKFRDDSDWERIGVMDNCQHLSVFLDRQQGRPTDFNSIMLFNSEYSASAREPPPAHDRQYSAYFNGEQIGHNLQLVSVYDKYKPDGSPEASTHQDYWVTVDYIYFSRSSELRLLSRLRLPTVAECAALRRLPNHVFPSDHLALAALFELAPAAAPVHTPSPL